MRKRKFPPVMNPYVAFKLGGLYSCLEKVGGFTNEYFNWSKSRSLDATPKSWDTIEPEQKFVVMGYDNIDPEPKYPNLVKILVLDQMKIFYIAVEDEDVCLLLEEVTLPLP